MNADPLLKIKAVARQYFHSARGSHDWEHTLRVVRLCITIGQPEGADMLVLEAAAYLHDIGRDYQDKNKGNLCHAKKSACMALPLIQEMDISQLRKENIIHCIEAHRFREDPAPCTLEAKVLFDADKLDAIGAVGIARAYLFAGELGACLHNPNLPPQQAQAYSKDDTGYREYVVKLSKVKDRMLTNIGKQMAAKRHAFMDIFFKHFLEEYDGKR
jgi:uncharacterized protein